MNISEGCFDSNVCCGDVAGDFKMKISDLKI